MEESFPMTGGDGPYSYAKNSSRQKEGADAAKEMLTAGIIENLTVETPTSKKFAIADLGCSTGPNTFTAVDNIIQGVTQKYNLAGHSTASLPEFQAYFGDHFSNDFNVLFANLPPSRKYFSAGVPGSFHGRLFPRASLDFVYSAFALHWLSRAPPELVDFCSPACNRGRIYYANAPDEVGQAYSAQYAKDMEAFLGARAAELASGGLMVFLLPGRPDGTLPRQSSLGPFFQPLESCLIDMVDEGIISRDEIDSFNLPMYAPSMEELRELIQTNGQFTIGKFEPLPTPPSTPLPSAGEARAALESIITKHFGSEIIDQLFDRYVAKLSRLPQTSVVDGSAIGLFVLLRRNH